jgi:hypothetical protein
MFVFGFAMWLCPLLSWLAALLVLARPLPRLRLLIFPGMNVDVWPASFATPRVPVFGPEVILLGGLMRLLAPPVFAGPGLG